MFSSSFLGIDFVFQWSERTRFFALLVGLIGTCILPYAFEYLRSHERRGRFIAVFLLFALSMLGVVTADNLILIFVCWELTSWFSFLLIGFDSDRPEARRAALQSLLSTMGGGLFLLAGLIIWGESAGSYSFSGLIQTGAAPSTLAFSFLMVGVATKAAQFPFHFWLPNAMEAPTPVSAYLHSATLVKAGVFLLSRISEMPSLPVMWSPFLSGFGAVSFILGAFFALREKSLKRVLAYSTISSIGWLLLVLSVRTSESLYAFDSFLIAHAGYKSSLFLCAGIILYSFGLKDLKDLKGIARQSGILAGILSLGLISMIGLPPSLSFVAKETGLGIFLNQSDPLLMAVVTLGSSLMAAVGFKLLFLVWAKNKTRQISKKVPILLWLPSLILVVAPYGWLRIPEWHFKTFILSLVCLLLGFVIWKVDQRIKVSSTRAKLSLFDRLYDLKLKMTYAFADRLTSILQPKPLSLLLVFILLGFSILGLIAIFAWTWDGMTAPVLSDWALPEVAACFLMLASAVSLLFWRHRLVAVLALGLSGYGLALVFLIYGAPDLAFTQFLIETLLLVLFAGVIKNFPNWKRRSSRLSIIRSAIISTAVGFFVAAATALSLFSSRSDNLKNFFSERSFTEAFGRNIVNVILVDFRGLDTLGEISVLAIAGLGAWSLYRFAERRSKST